MQQHTDISIVGGGLNGMVMAAAAQSGGLSVAVFETQSHDALCDPAFDGRGYALSHASVRMLQALGLWGALAADAQPILNIHVSDAVNPSGISPMVLHFDHRELEEGPMGHLVEDRHFRAVILDWVEKNNIQICYECPIQTHDVQTGFVQIYDHKGRTNRSNLLIAADGRNSAIAKRAGLKKHGWRYNQTALVCAIEHSMPHHGTAHQLFTPAGPLAILPLTGNRSAIVWTEHHQKAAQLHQGPADDYLRALQQHIGDFLGDLSLIGGRYAYPLELRIAQQFVKPRVALIGEAAHGIHPLAGQGLNLGLHDIAALCEIIADARKRGQDIGDLTVLEQYQQWRRFDAQSMGWATDTINRIFSNDISAVRVFRDLGLGMVDAVPPLRRAFMRHAAGLRGSEPKLLRGQLL